MNAETAWCPTCRTTTEVDDTSDEQYRDRRGWVTLNVTRLVCGHQLTYERSKTPYPVDATGMPYIT